MVNMEISDRMTFGSARLSHYHETQSCEDTSNIAPSYSEIHSFKIGHIQELPGPSHDARSPEDPTTCTLCSKWGRTCLYVDPVRVPTVTRPRRVVASALRRMVFFVSLVLPMVLYIARHMPEVERLPLMEF